MASVIILSLQDTARSATVILVHVYSSRDEEPQHITSHNIPNAVIHKQTVLRSLDYSLNESAAAYVHYTADMTWELFLKNDVP